MKVEASDREWREYQVLRLVGLEQSSRQSSTYNNNTCNHKTKITDFCYIVRLSTFNVVSLSYHLSFSIDSAACCFAAIKFRSFFIDILCINFDLPFTIENWFTQDSASDFFSLHNFSMYRQKHQKCDPTTFRPSFYANSLHDGITNPTSNNEWNILFEFFFFFSIHTYYLDILQRYWDSWAMEEVQWCETKAMQLNSDALISDFHSPKMFKTERETLSSLITHQKIIQDSCNHVIFFPLTSFEY